MLAARAAGRHVLSPSRAQYRTARSSGVSNLNPARAPRHADILRPAGAISGYPWSRRGLIKLQAASGGQGIPTSEVQESSIVVQEFVDAFNRRDFNGMMEQYDEACVLEDLSYDTLVEGRQEVGKFMQNFIDGLPDDARLVVDCITSGDSESVGLMWHLEIGGKDVPFGKGLSFYRISYDRKISYVRQCPEHLAKVAFAAPSILAAAAPLVRMDLGSLFSGQQQDQKPSWAQPLSSTSPAVSASGSKSSSPVMASPSKADVNMIPLGDSSPSQLPRPVPEAVFTMNDKWSKDKASSDLSKYDQALDMMGVKGIQKTTAELIDGLELQVTETEFTMRFLTIVPYFKVTESYAFNTEKEMGRRDLRPGWQRGTASILPDGQVQLVVELGPADGWQLTERFSLLEPNKISVESTVLKNGTEVGFVQVYTRGHS